MEQTISISNTTQRQMISISIRKQSDTKEKYKMPKIKCAVSICREYVELPDRYCEKHKGNADKTYNREVRYNKDNVRYARFYASSAWRKARRIKLAQQPLCEECLREGKITAATIVHHMIELKDDWNKRLDADNLESICQDCHNKKHKRLKTP